MLGSFFAPLLPGDPQRLTTVQGQVEVVAPGYTRPQVILSPDGRYMIFGRTSNGEWERGVLDLKTDPYYPFDLTFAAVCWLDPEQFVVRQDRSNYVLVQAEGAAVTPAEVGGVPAPRRHDGTPDPLAAGRPRVSH